MKLFEFLKVFAAKRKKFITYYFIGNLVVIIDFLLLYFLTEILSIYYLVSASMSFIAASSTHYLLNKKYTFQNKSRRYALQYFLVLALGIFGLLLNLVILFVLVEYFSVWYIYAKVVSLLLILTFSYTVNKHIIFGRIK